MSLVKAIGVACRTIQGFKTVKRCMALDWKKRLADLEHPEASYDKLAGTHKDEYLYDEHLQNLCMMAAAEEGYFPKPSQIYHAVIVAMYDETLDVLAPTMDCLLKTTFDKKHMIVVIAYEERGGESAEKVAKVLQKNYGKKFGGFILSKHPADIEGEVIGKGGNIANSIRTIVQAAAYIKKLGRVRINIDSL